MKPAQRNSSFLLPTAQHSNRGKRMKPAQRNSGIDIVKIVAAILVTCVHFFYNTGFYTYIPITGSDFILPISVLWVFYTCVPLFMITTGYLMKNKTLSGKYYTGIIRVVVFYLVCSTICMFFRKSLGAQFTFWTGLRGYLQFNMCDYAWYVEQYIVMFLIIPFLNLAYNGLQNKRQKQILVCTVFFLFALAPTFYIGFDFKNQIQPLPSYMQKAFPIAYYYIGCYIREYPPKRTLKNKLTFFGIGAVANVILTYGLYRGSINNTEYEQHFYAPHMFNYDCYLVVILATCIFLLLFDIPAPKAGKLLPEKAASLLTKTLSILSQTTLLTYLFSYIFDMKFYNPFNNKYPYPDFMLRFRHFFEVQPKVYVCSLLCALPVLFLYNLADWFIRKKAAGRKARKEEVHEV